MIRLILGDNIVALTLKEKVTIVNPIFLFEFINNQGYAKTYCIAEDISSYPDRYNLFTLVVLESTPDPLVGEIELNIGDEYTYNVYQQASSTNLDPALAEGVVENGMMTYDKAMTSRNEFNPTEETRVIYEP
jgi:hypothetical protein